MKIPQLLFTIITPFLVYSQPSTIQNDQRNIYIKQSIAERNPVAWPYLPERDVFICKYVERMIDTREKMNLCMRWPQQPLMEVIYNALKEGKIHAYKTALLDSTYDSDDARMIGSITTTINEQLTEDEYNTRETRVTSALNASEIKKFKVMENWIFDRNTGEQYTRIYAIAPIYNLSISGVLLGEQPLFFLSYKECRKLFVNTPLFNRQNDAAQLSYDDFFEQRLFSSCLLKTSNVFDLAIRDMEAYKLDGIEALMEGNVQNENLFNTEHDLWEY